MNRNKDTFDLDEFVENWSSMETDDGEIDLPQESLEDFLRRSQEKQKNKKSSK